MDEINELDLGALESPKDERDYKIGQVQEPVKIPETFLPDYSNLPVYSQKGQPACGGHAGAKFQNILLGLGSDLSPRFVYALCKKIDGYNGPGTYGRSIMAVLQKYGVCSNELFPNDVSLPHDVYADWTLIPQAAYIDALTRRIGPYAQVDDRSFQGQKQAIYQNKAVLVLKKPWIPNTDTGHFFVENGYDKTEIRFSNSFGKAWAIKGDGHIKESDMPTILEAWTTISEPQPDLTLKRRIEILKKIVELLTQALAIKGRLPK